MDKGQLNELILIFVTTNTNDSAPIGSPENSQYPVTMVYRCDINEDNINDIIEFIKNRKTTGICSQMQSA